MTKRAAPIANVKAEQSFLGALLRSPHSYFQVNETVKADFFTVPIHKSVYQVIADVMEGGRSLSFTVLGSRLPPETEDGQDTAALLQVLAHNSEGLSALDFADQIAETANRRRLLAISEAIAKAARAGDSSAIDIASEAETALLDVMQVSSPRRPRLLSEVAHDVVAAAKTARDKDIMPGFTWGLSTLDEVMGLVLPGDLGSIVASQGDGKSALATQFGEHVARDRPVVMCQMEMGQEQIAARELAAYSGLPVRAISEGSFDAFGWDSLKGAQAGLQGLGFWILDVPEITVRQLRAHCVAMQRTHGLALLIVDQLDKVKGEGRYRDRFERGAEITRDLKFLARDLKVAVVVLAQRTRGAQRRDDPMPDILDADFPSLERDCDWVLALWRKETWLRRNKPNPKAGAEEMERWEHEIRRCSKLAEVMALKRRRGGTYDARPLAWHGPTTRFSEVGND